MPKITPHSSDNVITVKTQPDSKKNNPGDWWNGNSKKEILSKFLGTIAFLKEVNQFRYRQSALYARVYGNLPVTGWLGQSLNRVNTSTTLPMDRPTMSVATSCTDTLVSRITQSRPRPIFLTDNADYKKRNLAKQMNNFINGELYQTKAYEKAPLILRDACVLGTGILKILEDQEKKVSLERRMCTEILLDLNDAFDGAPRQLYEIKLVDRQVLASQFPKYRSDIEKAEEAYPDNSADSSKTISDLVMVAEGWHLESGPDAGDGLHIIACSEGIICEEKFTKKKFPFVFLHYSPRLIGPWGQGLIEQLMGTQMEINKLLMTISKSINLVGVPRVFVEQGSKVVKAHLNNEIGSIVTYSGTKPEYSIAPCVPAELYQQLQRLVDYAYQQSGISALAAASQKPLGLNSGVALREYDDLQTDRFATLARSYDMMFVDLAYQIVDLASDIAIRDGKYQTVYPNKDGTKEINLPDAKELKDPYVIQCYDASSLPRDPAGRLQKVTEMMQAGLVTPQEGRRLLDFPDIQQVDKLANASEERILKILDEIVEEGKYTPPDPFMDLALATQLVTQYYNLYSTAKLDEEKAQLLRDFFSQLQALKQAAMPPAPLPQAPGAQMALPQGLPQSDLLANVKPAA